jgi:hypothetical protein
MLSWLESPWSCHLDGDSASVSWKSFHQCLASPFAKVAVHNSENSPGALGNPDCNDPIQKGDLGKIGELKMVVNDYDDQDNQRNVQVLERFIEGVSNDGIRLNRNRNKNNSALWDVSLGFGESLLSITYDESVHDHGIGSNGFLNSSPSTCVDGRSHPGDRMSKSLKDHNPSKPSMQQVKGVKGQVEPVDERVISCCHDE